jgi:hypothetical protein
MLSVQSLRAAGYKVRVCHKRHFSIFAEKDDVKVKIDVTPAMSFRELDDGLPTLNALCMPYSIKPISFSVEPRGGLTLIEITTPDGTDLKGEALCSKRDNYDKKKGVKIALGRALKNTQADPTTQVNI